MGEGTGAKEISGKTQKGKGPEKPVTHTGAKAQSS